MGKSHFLPRTFSHFRQVLERILRQLRVIGWRHLFFSRLYCRCWNSFLCFIKQIKLMLCSLSPLSLLMWGCFCFSWDNEPSLYIFLLTQPVLYFSKEKYQLQKWLLSLHLGKRRIYHQTAFKHLVYALPHLTRFHISHLEAEKNRYNLAYDQTAYCTSYFALVSISSL